MTPAQRPDTPTRAGVRAVVRAVWAHPTLWPTALVQGRRMVGPRWWRRAPHLPLPDRALWSFRMETAYGGDGDRRPAPEDVRTYLRWCQNMRVARRN